MKTIETKTQAETRFLNLNQTSYLDNNGKIKTWFWAQRPNKTNAVMIVATVEDVTGTKLVLTKEFRIPLDDYEYGFPAGLIDPGESPIVSAQREFHEETGLELTQIIRPISPLVYNSAGLTDEGIHIAFAKAMGTVDSSKAGDSEDIQVLLLDKEQVDELLANSNIKIGAKAYLIMLNFAQTGKL